MLCWQWCCSVRPLIGLVTTVCKYLQVYLKNFLCVRFKTTLNILSFLAVSMTATLGLKSKMTFYFIFIFFKYLWTLLQFIFFTGN